MTDDWYRRVSEIHPSARKPIHPVGFQPSTITDMGRYGLEKREEGSGEPSSPASSKSVGVDEVDDAAIRHNSSMTPPIQVSNKKRNSIGSSPQRLNWSGLHDGSGDRSPFSPMSQSLPASLFSSSELSLSDSSEHDELQWTTEISSQVVSSPGFAAIPRQTHRDRLNYSNSDIQDSSPSLVRVQKKTQKKEETHKEQCSKIPLICAVVIVIIGVLLYFYLSESDNVKSEGYNEIAFENDIDSIGDRYGIDSDAVLKIQSGISTIFKKSDTSSFIFLYNSKGRSEDYVSTVRNFAAEVARAAAKYLRNDTNPSPRHIMVEQSDLDMEFHGDLIQKYRYELEQRGVMLVPELQGVPGRLAMAFHYYCDEYNPLVKRTAVFFTLDLSECSVQQDKQSDHSVIENCLAQKWVTSNGVPQDNIGPLMTRIVNVVISL